MVNKESDEKKDCRCNKQQKVSFWLWTVKLERINSPELVFAWLQDARASSSCLVVVVVHQLMLIAMQVLAAVGSPKGCSPQRSSASKTSPQIECLPFPLRSMPNTAALVATAADGTNLLDH